MPKSKAWLVLFFSHNYPFLFLFFVSFRPTPADLLGDPVFHDISCQYPPFQKPVKLFSSSLRCAHLELPDDINDLCKGLLQIHSSD